MRILAMAVVMAAMGGVARAQDDGGFVRMLNQARAARGLSPVAHNPAAAWHAYENNRLQSAYGLGHHHTGGLGQVAAVGVADARSALQMWMNSPPHFALLFAPDLVSVAYHQLGGVATASTQQSFAVVQQQWAYPQQYYYAPPGWRMAR